jgi:DNA primase
MVDFTPNEVASYYAARVPSLRQTETREWRGLCPVHNGNVQNFAVKAETGQAHCHSQCGRGWDLIGLEMELSRSDFPRAKTAVFSIVGRPTPSREDAEIEAVYDYADAAGKLVYQVVRRCGKRFLQRQPDGSGGWIWNLKGVAPVPYRLPEVVATKLVAIVEGEKDADNLRRMGIVATCNNGGAGKFTPEMAKWFYAGMCSCCRISTIPAASTR